MSDFLIETAGIQDLACLSNIFQNNLDSSVFPAWPENKILESIEDPTVVVRINLCGESSKLSGFCITQFLQSKAEIQVLAVDKPMRRRGIGSSLLLDSWQQAVNRRISILQLMVLPSNLAAVEFYRNHHFHINERVPRYYAGKKTALRMQKQLTAVAY